MSLADAMAAFSSEVRLRRSDPGFYDELIDLPEHTINQPEDNELGYREFVSALIKIAVIDKAESTNVGPAI